MHHSPPHTPQRTAGWCHVYINTFVYIILYVYTVSATAILCLSCVHRVVCTYPCLTLGPFQMSRQLLAHHKQKYNLQVGIVQCKLYVCNTFYDAAYVLPLVCVGMVGNDGGLFTHHHSQFYGLVFYFCL